MPALAKRVLNPGNKWLWIAGGVLVAGGAWWYFGRKKEEKAEEEKAAVAKRVLDVSDRAEAQSVAAQPVEGKVVTVWMRNGKDDDEVFRYIKQLAAQHKDITFYFFREGTFGDKWSKKTGVVVGAADNQVRKAMSKWGLSDKVGDAKKGIDRAIPYLTGEKTGTVTGPIPATVGDVLPLPKE